MNNYKIIIEYEGTNFVGWQKQENGESIQNLIEVAIHKLTSEKTTIFGAGRTDAGVHAIAQVANFKIKKQVDLNEIRDGINQYLRPNPVAILKAENADDTFHSRFSAKLRWYKYNIINRRPPLTLENKRAWCIHKSLDIEKMLKEAEFFIGKFDMSAFRSANCQSKSTVKTIESFDVNINHDNIIFTVSAKSFLHSQVRIMVGTLIDIGRGLISRSVTDIILSKKREYAGMTAPACGLYLKKIDY